MLHVAVFCSFSCPVITHNVDKPEFIYSPAERHVGSLQFGEIMNKVALSKHLHIGFFMNTEFVEVFM